MFPMHRKWICFLSLQHIFWPCSAGVEVWEGESVVLPCLSVGTSSTVDVYWCKLTSTDCTSILSTISGNKKVQQPWSATGVDLINSTSLIIPSVSYSRDNGSFQCHVVSREKVSLVRLTVMQPVRSVNLTGPKNPISENSMASFRCQVNGGSPPLVIKWHLNDTPNKALNVTKQSDHRSDAQLMVTRTLNNKTIKCEASVREKSVFRQKTIYIAYKPNITITSSKSTIVYGEIEHAEGIEFDLYCLADANPPADVTWSFKRKTVNNNVYRIINFDQSKTGMYECSATNREGTERESVVLTLKENTGLLQLVVYWMTFITGLSVILLLFYVARCLKLNQGHQPEVNDQKSLEAEKCVTANRNLMGNYAKIWFEKRATGYRQMIHCRERTEYATIDFKATALLAQRIKEEKVTCFQEQHDDSH